MKTLLFFTCLLATYSSFAQKTIPVKNAHELAVAMNNGNFVGTSDIGASVRISELPEHIIVKNYTANSELKITKETKEEKTTSKATGIIYTGNYKIHPVKITMIVQGDKIRAKVAVGEQRMVVVGVIKTRPTN